MKLSDRIKEVEILVKQSILIVSDDIHAHLLVNHYDYAVMSCGCQTENGVPKNLWSEIDTTEEEDIVGNKAHYLHHVWCVNHGDTYLLEIINS